MRSPSLGGLLGGLQPGAFLRRYWQKRPLFVRAALPHFTGVVDKRTLTALARRDDVESRIVVTRGRRRQTAHGPFARVSLPESSTLLVNGVNHHVAAADELLQRFAFVPQARLDDVMVSYATPCGGGALKTNSIWRIPATCCTCRPACATTAWRSITASRTRSASARRAAPSSARRFSIGCTSAACRTRTTATALCGRHGARARYPTK